jgi:hypothetical protein
VYSYTLYVYTLTRLYNSLYLSQISKSKSGQNVYRLQNWIYFIASSSFLFGISSLSCLLLLWFPLIWKKSLKLTYFDLVLLMTFKFYSHTYNSDRCCIIQLSQPNTPEDSSGTSKMKVSKKTLLIGRTYVSIKSRCFITFFRPIKVICKLEFLNY